MNNEKEMKDRKNINLLESLKREISVAHNEFMKNIIRFFINKKNTIRFFFWSKKKYNSFKINTGPGWGLRK